MFPERGAAVFSTGDKQVPDPSFKNVPGANTLGVKGLRVMRWVGVHPDTPDDIANAISTKLGALLRDKKVVDTLAKTGEPPEFLPRAEAQKQYFKMVNDKGVKAIEIRHCDSEQATNRQQSPSHFFTLISLPGRKRNRKHA